MCIIDGIKETPMTPEEMKMKGRGWSTDMSPEAIARRIDIVSELRTFALWLGTAKNLGPVDPEAAKKSRDQEEKSRSKAD